MSTDVLTTCADCGATTLNPDTGECSTCDSGSESRALKSDRLQTILAGVTWTLILIAAAWAEGQL